jgi:putative tricarboxylic transport membrane protein
MDWIVNLSSGFAVALTPVNLLVVCAGCLLGTLIGVLPGISPVSTIAVLLPATYALEPVSALILLAGVYYGVQYSGSTPAILLNQPGEASSALTCSDGFAMTAKGRAGPALAAAGLGSFLAGSVATLVLVALAMPLTELAVQFGPAEYFALMAVGLTGAVVLASGPLLKALGMAILGMLLGLVGTDVNLELSAEVARFSFGFAELVGAPGVVLVALGIFVYAEIIGNLAKPFPQRSAAAPVRWSGLLPERQDFMDMLPAMLRGTVLGSVLGMLPGGGALLSAAAAYTLEKKIRGRAGEEVFGQGNIRGVAAPEAANNAGAQSSFVPLLTLGIPANAVMALMAGAMMIHGIRPGPQVMTAQPDLFWGLIASMWVGNAVLLILNLPLVGIWIKLFRVSYRYLFPVLLLLSVIGVYVIRYNILDVWLMTGFAVLGYVLVKISAEPAPLLLGFVLGPLMEESLRRTLLLSGGDWGVFVTRPLSAGLLGAAAVLLLLAILPSIKTKRQQAWVGD